VLSRREGRRIKQRFDFLYGWLLGQLVLDGGRLLAIEVMLPVSQSMNANMK